MRSAVAVHAIFAPVGIPPRGRRRARVARIGTGTATHVLRTVTGCRAIDETLHAVAQLLHLAGEHHHLMAKFFHSRRAAPRSVGHRAGPGGAVGRLRTVTDRRAARFRAAAALPVAGSAFAHFRTAVPRCQGARLRAAAFFTADIGLRRLRPAAFLAAGVGLGWLGPPTFFAAGIGPGGLGGAAFFAADLKPGWFGPAALGRAALGVFTGTISFAARLVWRLGIRGTRETQGGEHG